MASKGMLEQLANLSNAELTKMLEWVQSTQTGKYEPTQPIEEPLPQPTEEELQRREKARKATEHMKVARKDKAGRLHKMKLHKEKTPIKLAEAQFLGEQRARGNSEKTVAGYGRTFKKFCLFAAYMYGEADGERLWDKDLPQDELVEIGSLFTIDILEADDLVEDFRFYITDIEGSSEITANYYMRHLKAIVNYFAEMGVIEERKIVIKEILPSIKDVYNDDELRKLLRRPADEDNFVEVRNWAAIQTLMGTGCRISTLAALRVGDIDFDNGLIIMNKQKNGVPNIVPLQQGTLSPVLREFIYSWRCDEAGEPLLTKQLFCRSDGEETTIAALKRSIHDYNLKRGVQKTSCHLFRHTFAKRWILAGKSAIELKKVLNHSSMKMVEHYSNLWAKDTTASIEEASLLSQVKKPKGKTIKKANSNKLVRRK